MTPHSSLPFCLRPPALDSWLVEWKVVVMRNRVEPDSDSDMDVTISMLEYNDISVFTMIHSSVTRGPRTTRDET